MGTNQPVVQLKMENPPLAHLKTITHPSVLSSSKLPYEVTPEQAMSHEEVRSRLEASSQTLRAATDKVLNSIVSSLDNIPWVLLASLSMPKHLSAWFCKVWTLIFIGVILISHFNFYLLPFDCYLCGRLEIIRATKNMTKCSSHVFNVSSWLLRFQLHVGH